jgi:hypothetical protein
MEYAVDDISRAASCTSRRRMKMGLFMRAGNVIRLKQ